MYIGEIISSYYAEVSPTDTVREVLDRIDELHIRQLPIVEEDELIGMIQEEDLLAAEDDDMMIKDIRRTSAFVYVYDHQHIYDALRTMAVYGYDIVPVIDKERKYIGTVTYRAIIEVLNSTVVTDESGAIIVLEMENKDYALSQLSRIIEAENTQILSITSHQLPDTDRTEMSIKVDKSNISGIIAALRRYDYMVKATFNDGNGENDIQNRYEHLMNYLDI